MLAWVMNLGFAASSVTPPLVIAMTGEAIARPSFSGEAVAVPSFSGEAIAYSQMALESAEVGA